MVPHDVISKKLKKLQGGRSRRKVCHSAQLLLLSFYNSALYPPVSQSCSNVRLPTPLQIFGPSVVSVAGTCGISAVSQVNLRNDGGIGKDHCRVHRVLVV